MLRRALPVLALSIAVALAGCDGDPPATPDAGPAGDAGGTRDAAMPDGAMPDGAMPDGGAPVCGDGVIEGDEACDDANDDAADGCSDTCEVEDGYGCSGEPSVCTTTCGDGVIAGMEACDDSGTDPGDGCSDTCTLEAGYTCTGAPSTCVTMCGDGIVAGMEMCDDGDLDALDGCSDTCTVEAGVTCTGSPSVCTATCGDGVVATLEACDDGDTDDGDGCSMACVVERGFSCAGEPSACMTGCGDGIVAGTETCDDGDMTDGDGCSMACATEPGYACSGEPSACMTVCGDGVMGGTETCDDGDMDSGDGCSSVCAPETGYTCVGTPSVCTGRCGDGIRVGAEVCDDGNISRGDGCDHLCAPEFGFTCAGTPSACTLSETVAQVSLGIDGGCIRTVSGRVACFGQNSQGELGDGTRAVEGHLPTDTGITDATLVVSGEEHHCALRAGGTMWCWGDNSELQQGVAGATDQTVPQQLVGLTGITAIAAGYDHNCIIHSGSVLCWGDNDNRQLGQGGTSTTDSEIPSPVSLPGGLTASSIALGGDHSCALLADATVACWGDDDNGQLGDGTSGTDSGDATLVTGLTSIAQIAASSNNTCARTTAGAVFCWGDNLDGQVGDGTTTDRATPTAVTLPAAALDITMGEDFVCALVTGGGVYCWGESADFETGVGSNMDQTSPVAVRGLSGVSVADVEAGGRGACVLSSTGRRRCWGHSEEGQLGIAPLNQLSLTSALTFAGGTPSALIVSPAAYRGQMCGLMPDSSVECAGTGDSVSTSTVTGSVGVFPGIVEHLGRLTPVPLLTGTLSGGFGSSFGCGRTATAVACVGDASQLQLGQGTSTTDSATPVFVMGLGTVDEVEVGSQFACARTGGTVQCWGDNDNYQCGEGTTTIDQGMPVTLMGLTDATDVELGDNHGCALRTGGAVSCWGIDAAGQLGQGSAGADMAAPVTVMGLPAAGASALTVGRNHACVLAGGEVWCWGDNLYGQLGQGTQTDSATPLMVPGITDATALVAGYNFNCALRTGGTVSCWGYGLDGQLGNGGRELTGAEEFLSPVDWIGATGILEMAASNSFTCLRDASGWRCAGFRGEGQLGDGTTLTPTSAWPVMTL